MSAITLSHSPAEGTLADGTTRGDSAGQLLKAHRFRYSRTIGMWYLPHSRDKLAQIALIERTAAALREAGHSVETAIDNATTRSYAEAETDRAERTEARAERFSDYADNAAARADARYQAGHSRLDAIPMGQPILVGHHSERRDRAYRNRAVDESGSRLPRGGQGRYWSSRADASTSHQAQRHSTGTTLRRIEKLEADERFWANTLKNGYNSSGWTTDTPERVEEINRRLAHVREQLEYWRKEIAIKEQAGVKVWSKPDFQVGDFARIDGHWHEVMRVNTKSLTVPYLRHPAPLTRRDDPNFLWTWTRPYNKVTGRMSVKEVRDAVHELALYELADQPPAI